MSTLLKALLLYLHKGKTTFFHHIYILYFKKQNSFIDLLYVSYLFFLMNLFNFELCIAELKLIQNLLSKSWFDNVIVHNFE